MPKTQLPDNYFLFQIRNKLPENYFLVKIRETTPRQLLRNARIRTLFPTTVEFLDWPKCANKILMDGVLVASSLHDGSLVAEDLVRVARMM